MADSTITFICDAGRVNGTITWYKWQFANGTDLGNTTERAWAYKVKEGDNILMFECIVGNTVGQSAPSAPIAVQTRGMYVSYYINYQFQASLNDSLMET